MPVTSTENNCVLSDYKEYMEFRADVSIGSLLRQLWFFAKKRCVLYIGHTSFLVLRLSRSEYLLYIAKQFVSSRLLL